MEPFSVIYQSAEDGMGDTIKPRLMEASADLDRVLSIVEDKKQLSLLDERIEKAIREHNARLMILDPIQGYIGSRVDINRANEIRTVLKSVSSVAERTGCAVVLISGNGEELERVAERTEWNSRYAGAVFGADAESGNPAGIGTDAGSAADDGAVSPGRYECSDDGVPHLHRDHGDEFGETGWESEREIFQDALQRRSTYGKMEQEAALDFGNPFGGPDSVGAGAAALVGSLSRLKGTSNDPEERKRELEAKRSADNLGVAIGLAIAAAEALREKQTEKEEHNREHQMMQ